MVKIGVLGAGSWGLGLAMLLHNNGHDVTVWSVFPDEINELNATRENKKCLPGVIFPESVKFCADTEKVVTESDVLILAVASPYTRSTAKIVAPYVKEGQYIVNVGKGIEEESLKTLCEVTKEEVPQAVVAVLSGPSHAEEVGRGIPTTCVIGTANKKDAEYLQNMFMSNVFRVYISPDVLGICIGGALKNVIALAAGIAMGADFATFSGLSGIGDLIVTCASMHSRNRRAGILIGKGYTTKEAMDEVQMVVEGVYAAKAAKKLAEKYNVEMPIVEQVNQVLFDGKSPADGVKDLMLRDKKIEAGNVEWH